MIDFLFGAGDILGDISVAFMVTMCALLTYARAAFDRRDRKFVFYGVLTALGFTLWATRLWGAIIFGFDVVIAPVSQVGIAMLCGGYAATQVLALKHLKDFSDAGLKCFRDPEIDCQREDRLRQFTLNRKVK